MDWTTILRAQQEDFLIRLESDDIFMAQREGCHSELTFISEEEFKKIGAYYNPEVAPEHQMSDTFLEYLSLKHIKNQLGKLVLKKRLGNMIAEIEEKGKYSNELILSSDPGVKLKVIGEGDNLKEPFWEIKRDELEGLNLIVFIISEEKNTKITGYHFIIAGFLPKYLINKEQELIKITPQELLYSGGLKPYLESLINYTSVAKDYLEQQNYKATIKYCQKSLEVNTNNADTYLIYGLALFWLKDYQKAIAQFNKSIDLEPNNSKAYCSRGNAYHQINHKQEALDDYNYAIKINPQSDTFYFCRGNAMYQMGKIETAIKDYSQAIALNQQNTKAYYNRAIARYQQNDTEGAILDYTEAISLNPHNPKAFYNRALIYEKIGYKQSAIDDYEKAGDIYQQQHNYKWYQKAREKIYQLNSKITREIKIL